MELNAVIIGAREMAVAFDKAWEEIKLQMADALKKATIETKNKAQELSPIDTGRLRASITYQAPLFTAKGTMGIVGTNTKYAPYMESGTRPHMPPISALKGWAKRVLGNEDLAYVVARKIAKSGTKGRFYMKQALEFGQPVLNRYLKECLQKVVYKLAKG
jgi:HK97 gp10 family phage protein